MCEQDRYGIQDKLTNRDKVPLKDDFSSPSDSDPEEESASMPVDPEVVDLSSSEDEDNLCCAPERPPPASAQGQRDVKGTQSPFILKGGSSSFSSRSRNIFDCLDSAAKQTSSQLGQDNVIDGVFSRPPPPPPLTSGKNTSDRAGPLSPHGGQKGKRGVPDYLVHPERWTCYSLEDVPETSDSHNSMVAQQYLHSLHQRKELESSVPEEPFTPAFNQDQTSSSCDSSRHKIIFSRPGRAGRDLATIKLKTTEDRKKEKGLSHLEEKDEDDDEESEDEGSMREDGSKEEPREKATHEASVRRFCSSNKGKDDEEGLGMAAIKRLEEDKLKRKWGLQGNGGEEEEEESKQTKSTFVSFKKKNRKHYRTSEHDEA